MDTKKNVKVVILCGGEGTRLKPHIEDMPKPLVEIGGRPILWHIMKLYSYFGYEDFILCLGYMGHKIKEFFINYEEWKYFNLKLKNGNISNRKDFNNDVKDWNISLIDTGLESNTGERIRRIEKYIDNEIFFVTYGDAVSNIDLDNLLDFHKKGKKIATITCVKPLSQFGLIRIDEENRITEFKEKPLLAQWVNGGFFVFNKEIFKYLEENDILEVQTFERLARKRKLSAYKFKGFWRCMDTYKDIISLNNLWHSNKCPWKIWDKEA